MNTWNRSEPDILELPSGRLVRGRSFAGTGRIAGMADAETGDSVTKEGAGSVSAARADYELILLGTRRKFEAVAHGATVGVVAPEIARWVKWPDFRLPSDPADAAAAFVEAWTRSETERVGVGCAGGRGRTGTALACIAIIDGVPAAEAVDFVRANYSPHAVETPAQRRFVEEFSAEGTT